jgi:hypothetical protein
MPRLFNVDLALVLEPSGSDGDSFPWKDNSIIPVPKQLLRDLKELVVCMVTKP